MKTKLRRYKITAIIFVFTVLLSVGVIVVSWSGLMPPDVPVYTQSSAQEFDPYRLITKEEMLGDLEFYLSKLTEVHPNPYRFATEAEFNARVEEVTEKINAYSGQEMQVTDFYRYVRELNGVMWDEHTTVHLYNTNPDRVLICSPCGRQLK